MHDEVAPMTYAEGLASSLPLRDDKTESDLISLVDIVITGVETGWIHFMVHEYDIEADGTTKPWAILTPLASAGKNKNGLDYAAKALYHQVVRRGVVAYLEDRLARGMSESEAAKMVDGSYTDAVVADSILQFILYGEEVYG